MSVAEAMLCGTPVIAFDIAAVPEVIIEGLNGYRVKDNNEMAKKMMEIDKISREAVREDTVKRFSKENVADEYLEFFKIQSS